MKTTFRHALLAAVTLACASAAPAQDYSKVFIIGDATVNGWTLEKSQPMEAVYGADAVFMWEGELNKGGFRLISQTDNWWPGFTAAVENGQDIEYGKTYDMLYSSNGAHDWKFNVTTPGMYIITADLKNLKLTVDKSSAVLPEEIWLTGDALGEESVAMWKDPKGRFRYNGVLAAGSIKAMTTAAPAEGTIFYVPSEKSADIQDNVKAKGTVSAEAAGYSVAVPSDHYRITFDVRTCEFYGAPFKAPENLYLIGGGTEAGWTVENAIPFTVDALDPYVFTLTTELKRGSDNQFKILGQKNWGPYNLHPYSPDASILDGGYVLENEGDDKWTIPADKEGIYTITVDTFNGTIKAEPGAPTAINEVSGDNDIRVSVSGSDIVLTSSLPVKEAILTDLAGRVVKASAASAGTIVFRCPASPAVYILKVVGADGTVKTQKVAL